MKWGKGGREEQSVRGQRRELTIGVKINKEEEKMAEKAENMCIDVSENLEEEIEEEKRVIGARQKDKRKGLKNTVGKIGKG